MNSDTIDLDVSLADGDAVVTVRITAWPTRPRWSEWDGGDPGDPGEWEVVEAVVPCERCDGLGVVPGDDWCKTCDGEGERDVRHLLTDDDQRRIDAAVQERMADHEEDER